MTQFRARFRRLEWLEGGGNWMAFAEPLDPIYITKKSKGFELRTPFDMWTTTTFTTLEHAQAQAQQWYDEQIAKGLDMEGKDQ